MKKIITIEVETDAENNRVEAYFRDFININFQNFATAKIKIEDGKEM